MGSNRKLYLLQVAALAAVYYGAAKLGLELAFETESVTAVWPPTGIALAALVLWGYRLWPGVALGALLANSWTGIPIYATLGITVGNTLEALAGAYLLGRFAGFRPSLERARDVIALVVLAGGLSTTISATIGVGSLLAADEIAAADFGSVWRTWWLGDMGGDLVVAPAVLVAVTHWPFRQASGRWREALGLAILVGGVSALVFTRDTSLTFLLFPPLILAALRFLEPGAAVATLLVASIAVPLTEADLGPFSGNPPDDRLLLAQTLVGVAGLTALLLAAVVTERRRAEDTAGRIADTLQVSLLPSQLPYIPGIDAAVHFRPAGRPHMVGGDFYDLFENDDGSWGAVIGDVRGKGAAAAATTGLARYTLRAAAVQERQPSRILELLNDAILRQSPEQSCTAAFARFENRDGEGSRVTLSLGGHPLPILLRADGVAESVGRPGTLLGVQQDPKLSDYSADLAIGDALVLFTDGLTDAYAPRRIVSQDELADIVASFAGRSATEIAAGIRESVLAAETGEPRDDFVIFVLRAFERLPV